MLSWSPFRLETYGSEHPGHRWVKGVQLLWSHVPQTVSSNASNVCFIHDCPICSKRSVLSAPPLMRYKFCGTTGWSVFGSANQSTGWSPLLQESVPIASPTCVALFPCCSTFSMSPTITSGPGTRLGDAGPIVCCMGAPIEIVPAIAPASDGLPIALANSFETTNLPLVIARDRAAGS